MVFAKPQKLDKRLANRCWVGELFTFTQQICSIFLGEYYPYFFRKVSTKVFYRIIVLVSLTSCVPSRMTVSSEFKRLVYLLGDKLHGKHRLYGYATGTD